MRLAIIPPIIGISTVLFFFGWFVWMMFGTRVDQHIEGCSYYIEKHGKCLVTDALYRGQVIMTAADPLETLSDSVTRSRRIEARTAIAKLKSAL